MSQIFLQSIWLVPCYPLIGAALAIPWSPAFIRLTGPRPAGYVNIIMTLVAFIHAILALTTIWNQPAQELLIPWLKVANLDLTIPIEISSVTVGATVIVTGLNLLAQIYAVGYMEMDWGWGRFYSLLGMFEAGMCGLALCDSLFFSYMILEVLTLGTYLLVGLWFCQPLVVTGARDAFLTKRVGDLVLLMGVLALYPLAGTWNFDDLRQWADAASIDPTVATLVGMALIAGPMGKCAQFPLHLWLDEAMEGPFPSTILRNSVVVSTGAWVLIKLEPVLALSPFVLSATVFVGAATAVGASLIAIAQIDVKRALSYSVSAYMGIIFIAVGTQQTEAALMLVFTYALAMALLVMSTGTIIANNVSQDLTQLGGLFSRRPISGIAFIVGAFGLLALPPFGSFWSLLKLADGLWNNEPALVALLLIVNVLTAFSLTRIFGLIFGGKTKPMTTRSPEVLWAMVLPMVILMGFTLHLPLLLAQFNLLPKFADINVEVALLLFGTNVLGCALSAAIYFFGMWPTPVQLPSKALQDFLAYDFYTAQLYRVSFVFVVALISRIAYWIDRYIVDGIVNLFGLVTVFSGQSLKYSTSGQSQFYALTILIGVALLGLIVSWSLLSHLSVVVGS